MKSRLLPSHLLVDPDPKWLNSAVASPRVARLEKHISHTPAGAFLSFVVGTIPGRVPSVPGGGGRPETRIDCREMLNRADFQVFSQQQREKVQGEAEGEGCV